jgi:hypothetical protein
MMIRKVENGPELIEEKKAPSGKIFIKIGINFVPLKNSCVMKPVINLCGPPARFSA